MPRRPTAAGLFARWVPFDPGSTLTRGGLRPTLDRHGTVDQDVAGAIWKYKAKGTGLADYESPTIAERPRRTSTLLLVLGFVIVVGAAASYLMFGREPTAGFPVAADSPTTSAPTTSARPTTTTPAQPSATTIAPPTVAESSTAVPDERIHISGIREQRTVDCAGQPVEIGGISNTVILTGHCGPITVSGIEHVITVDSADAIEVVGIRNRVTFHTGAPTIKVFGDNTVEQG